MPSRVNIAVLASGGGSNLQALLDWAASDGASGRIALVCSNRPDAGALARARAADVPAVVLAPDGADADRLLGALASRDIGLLVLAGYLKRVPDPVVAAFRGRVVNVHPALLPAFGGPGMYGRKVHEAVLASGVTVTGATVHQVDEQYDHGRVLAQWPVPVRPGDTADDLALRVLAVEHRLLPAAVELVCRALAAGAEVPAALRPAAGAFVLADLPEARFDLALSPA